MLLDETVRNVGHVGESSSEPLCRSFPPSTGKPRGNVLQNGDDVNKESTWVSSLAELGHGGIDQIDEWVLPGLNRIAVRKHQDESTGRPGREEREVLNRCSTDQEATFGREYLLSNLV